MWLSISGSVIQATEILKEFRIKTNQIHKLSAVCPLHLIVQRIKETIKTKKCSLLSDFCLKKQKLLFIFFIFTIYSDIIIRSYS